MSRSGGLPIGSGPHPYGVAPIANGVRHERHRDDRRTELAGSISKGTTAIMGIKGQVDHCAHGRDSERSYRLLLPRFPLQPRHCRTHLTIGRMSLNVWGERIPTSLGTAWAFTQLENHDDYVQTFRRQVVRLSGRRFRPLNSSAG